MSDDTPYAQRDSGAVAMRRSRVLRAVREGRVARCLKLNTADPRVAEIFASAQPDAIWVCMEHCGAGWTEIEHQIRAAALHDVDTFVRVARGSYSDYVRALELDAAGLIVPHVMGLEDAQMVRDFTKFAPVGRRALDGGNADARFLRLGLADYLSQANSERVVLHQIEDPEAADDLEAIAELDGVDGLFFGPGDYSVALGAPGQMDHAEVEAMRVRVAQVARQHNKIAATVCSQDQIRRHADLGYNFLNVGADVLALTRFADEAMAAFGDL
ncbi:MAG: aldolase [Rhodobacteraceae bacterium]|nr:aldolase [Paracoccaceae bacterium]